MVDPQQWPPVTGGWRQPQWGGAQGPEADASGQPWPNRPVPGPGGPQQPGQPGQPGPGHRPAPGTGFAPGQWTRPGIVPLAPLDLGRIIGGAFQLYRFNLQAILLMPLLLLGGASIVLSAGAFAADPSGAFVNNGLPTAGTLLMMIVLIAAVTVPSALGMLIIPSVSGTTHAAVIGHKAGPTAHMGRFLRRGAWTLMLSLLLALAFGLIGGIVVGVGAGLWFLTHTEELVIAFGIILGLAAVVGMGWISVRIMFAAIAIGREGCGPIEALRRSVTLTRGDFWRLFGIMVLCNIIVSVIQQVGAMVLMLPLGVAAALGVGDGILISGQGLMTGFTLALTLPFQYAVYTLAYLDRRMRTEGYDVTLAQQAAEVAADPTSECWVTCPPLGHSAPTWTTPAAPGTPGPSGGWA